MECRYKLLAFDLDGTALGQDPDAFAAGFAEAAGQAAAAGCVLVAATGRPGAFLPPPIAEGTAWLAYLVLCDGAQARDCRTGACLWSRAIGPAALARVEAAARAFAIPAEYVDAESRYHIHAEGWQALEKAEVSPFHRRVLERRGCLLDGPAAALAPAQILKINLPVVPPQVRAPFREMLERSVLAMDCGPGGMELTAPGTGKRAALELLAGRLGLTLRDVMAIGDSGNDAELLAGAGWGVAMGNARPEVKAVAKAVTGRNTEGGAAAAIRRWLLRQ